MVSVAKVIAPISRAAALMAIKAARIVKLVLTLAYELMLAPIYESIVLPVHHHVLVPFIQKLVFPCFRSCKRAVIFVANEFASPFLNYVHCAVTRPILGLGIFLCFTGGLMFALQSLGRLVGYDATRYVVFLRGAHYAHATH